MYAFKVSYSYKEIFDGKADDRNYNDVVTIFTHADARHAIEEVFAQTEPNEFVDEDGIKHESIKTEIFITNVELLAEEG